MIALSIKGDLSISGKGKGRREGGRKTRKGGRIMETTLLKMTSLNNLSCFPPSVKKAWWPKQIIQFNTMLVIS
jgi:hypothetical protein